MVKPGPARRVPEGSKRYMLWLYPEQIELIEAYQRQNPLAMQSDALRALLRAGGAALGLKEVTE